MPRLPHRFLMWKFLRSHPPQSPHAQSNAEFLFLALRKMVTPLSEFLLKLIAIRVIDPFCP
jgi:hypothetical protein